MAARASAALIAELEGAADGRSPERWAKMLRQLTTLFLSVPIASTKNRSHYLTTFSFG